MSSELFQPTAETEARVLMLIEAFSGGAGMLEGRTKLAKLDFFLRYPAFLQRALTVRGVSVQEGVGEEGVGAIETRMVRYKYGPWDPSHYAVLGRLIGKRLIIAVPYNRGIGFKATDRGRSLVRSLQEHEPWRGTRESWYWAGIAR